MLGEETHHEAVSPAPEGRIYEVEIAARSGALEDAIQHVVAEHYRDERRYELGTFGAWVPWLGLSAVAGALLCFLTGVLWAALSSGKCVDQTQTVLSQ